MIFRPLRTTVPANSQRDSSPLQRVHHQVGQTIRPDERQAAQLRGPNAGADQEADHQVLRRIRRIAGGDNLAQLANVEDGRLFSRHLRPLQAEQLRVQPVVLVGGPPEEREQRLVGSSTDRS